MGRKKIIELDQKKVQIPLSVNGFVVKDLGRKTIQEVAEKAIEKEHIKFIKLK